MLVGHTNGHHMKHSVFKNKFEGQNFLLLFLLLLCYLNCRAQIIETLKTFKSYYSWNDERLFSILKDFSWPYKFQRSEKSQFESSRIDAFLVFASYDATYVEIPDSISFRLTLRHGLAKRSNGVNKKLQFNRKRYSWQKFSIYPECFR